MILPVRLRRVASGLIIENVRCTAMGLFLVEEYLWDKVGRVIAMPGTNHKRFLVSQTRSGHVLIETSKHVNPDRFQ